MCECGLCAFKCFQTVLYVGASHVSIWSHWWLCAYVCVCVCVSQALTHKSMRERHWLEVMTITGHNLNLAEDVFKLQHLLDCNILKFREEVEDLTGAAVKEEQIENKLAAIQVCVCLCVCVCVYMPLFFIAGTAPGGHADL